MYMVSWDRISFITIHLYPEYVNHISLDHTTYLLSRSLHRDWCNVSLLTHVHILHRGPKTPCSSLPPSALLCHHRWGSCRLVLGVFVFFIRIFVRILFFLAFLLFINALIFFFSISRALVLGRIPHPVYEYTIGDVLAGLINEPDVLRQDPIVILLLYLSARSAGASKEVHLE